MLILFEKYLKNGFYAIYKPIMTSFHVQNKNSDSIAYINFSCHFREKYTELFILAIQKVPKNFLKK